MSGKIRGKKGTVLIGMGLVIIVLAGLSISSRYFIYSDMPAKKSDVIVLFIGSDEEARQNEARQLIWEGCSDFLFISSYLRLYRAGENRSTLSSISLPTIKTNGDLLGPKSKYENNGLYFKRVRQEFDFPCFYENTHVEILLTKKVMDAYGFKRAIFVSSPYHMRRIKIIAEKVFGSGYDIKMTPSRFERKITTGLPSLYDVQNTFTEIAKIIWFFCYEAFDR